MNNKKTSLSAFDITVIVVSFNTRALLDRCLKSIKESSEGLRVEIIVVDNASKDGSADFIKASWPDVKLLCSPSNLGFAAANNVGMREARGEYVVLLNSDAFLAKETLAISLKKIKNDSSIGLAGVKLIGEDRSWQPSARMFPTLFHFLITLSGLAAKYPRSKFFGHLDRTWASQEQQAEVDWVPGAFAIIPRKVLEKVGYFDERFFLYYEEVDLCRRIKQAGYSIWYWPEMEVIHLGGRSAATLTEHAFSGVGSQLTLWRMRSELIYFRKHHGFLGAVGVYAVEVGWHAIRIIKSIFSIKEGKSKRAVSTKIISLKSRALKETREGRLSPRKPW